MPKNFIQTATLSLAFLYAGFLTLQCNASSDIEPTAIPKGFTNVLDLEPSIQVKLTYFGSSNFIGRKIVGYEANKCYLSTQAARNLAKAQKLLQEQGYGLKVYDCYRPRRAVKYFVEWTKDPKDTLMKASYYPDFDNKRQLIKRGYISATSRHSRGGTVDVTLIKLATGEEVDMGRIVDFFGPISHPNSRLVNPEQRRNRMLLKEAMVAAGFKSVKTEWWHFNSKKEAFSSAFDFVIR